MATHWTDFPERVESFGDLVSILDTLDRHDREQGFTAQSFRKESPNSAYTVEPTQTGYVFTPRPERMPGLDRLLDRLEREGQPELTIAALRQLRGRVASAVSGTRSTVDAMTIAQVADALDTAERPTPPSTPAPAATIQTFQDFLWSVKSVEDAAGEMRATSEAMDGAPGSSRYRITAGLWEADAEYKKHPAFPYLEAYVNQRYGEFTHANLLRVRGDVCQVRQCGSTEASQLSPDEVAKLLGCPGATPPPTATQTLPERAGEVDSPAEYTVEDVRGLLRYRRARAEFDDKYSAMVARQGATKSVPDAMHLTYWSAYNTPQCGRLTEEVAVSIPLYHWLVVSARSLYQSDLNEDTLLLLVGMIGIQAKRDVADLMAMTVGEFDMLRVGVPATPPQTTPIPTTDTDRKLTDRQKLMLTEMLALKAVGITKKTTRATVVRQIDKTKTAADFARDFGALKTAKFTDSDAGPDGGVWLTGVGKTRAEELNAENE